MLYFVLGLAFVDAAPAIGGEVAGEVAGEISGTAALLETLETSFALGPATLLPLVVMLVCMFFRMPAIPAFLVAIVLGMIEAVLLQGCSVTDVLSAAHLGAQGSTGLAELDALLSTGGMATMMDTVSIVVLVMAFSGIVQYLHLIDEVIKRVAASLTSFAKLVGATVFSGALLNTLLPDQYPAITLSTQMYSEKFKQLNTPDTVWANIVNSSAGITSVLIPWNTCAVYMVTVLGVSCVSYAPYAFFCYLYPLLVLVIGAAFGRKLAWWTK